MRALVPALLATALAVGSPATRALPAADNGAEPLLSYLRGVLCRLDAEACQRVHLHMLDRGTFSTRIAADGRLVVHGGTLLRLRDEDELAVLLGHELAHLEAGHAAARQQAREGRERDALARRQERDADARGRQIAAEAGYDPSAAADLWTRHALERAGSRLPAPRESIYPSANARATAAPRSRERSPASTSRFRSAIDPHLETWLAQAVDGPDLGATLVMLGALHRDAPPGWRGRTGFALAEAHRRRRDPGDTAIAQGLYLEASQSNDAPSAVFRELGHGFAAAGDAARAERAFRAYREASPDAEDLAFLEPPPLAPPLAPGPDKVPGLRAPLPQGWRRRDSVAESRWTPQEGHPPLRFLSGIAPGEHLLAGRQPRRDAPTGGVFDPGLRADEWPRMLRHALRDAGWVDVEAKAVRPWRFGRIVGVRLAFAMTHPDGALHAGQAAMLVRDGRMTLAYWQAPLGADHAAMDAAVARVLDGLQAE